MGAVEQACEAGLAVKLESGACTTGAVSYEISSELKGFDTRSHDYRLVAPDLLCTVVVLGSVCTAACPWPQLPLSPIEAEREAKSIFMGGGMVAGIATGAGAYRHS